MGVYIFLDILPNEIDRNEWESVYEESLELIHAYPFMDSFFDRDTYGCDWRYVDRAKEIVFDGGPFDDPKIGWHVFGDLKSMLSGESFALYRELEGYQKRSKGSSGTDDILASLINSNMSDDQYTQQAEIDKVTVFDGKTQGFPFHNYLLAIACLFESRFPRQTIITGDVTIAQMQKAINWANTILKEPVQLTERADNEKLLQRIREIAPDDSASLKVLISQTMQALDDDFGEFVRKNFSKETITAFFTEKFKQYTVNMTGFRIDLQDYFRQGFSLEDACDICALDPNGCLYDATAFAETVLSFDWQKEEDDSASYDFTKINDPNREEPETIPSLFGKTFLKMAGSEGPVKTKLSYQEVVTILQDKLGSQVAVENLVKDENNENSNAKVNDLLQQLMDDMSDEKSDSVSYTIDDLDQLINWEKGDTVHPEIEQFIAKVKDFVEKSLQDNEEIYNNFQQLSDWGKMQKLINRNRSFLLQKKAWDNIAENLDQENMMNAVLSILMIDADGLSVNKLCKALLNNHGLLHQYILYFKKV